MNIIHCAAGHRSRNAVREKIIFSAANINKEPILTILREYIQRGAGQIFLEIASGSGQHVAHFAPHFPHVTFYPSDYELKFLHSIAVYANGYSNVRNPLRIDVTTDFRTWGNGIFKECGVDYIYNSNMMHITPYKFTVGLFENAGKLLKPNGLLFTYGPYALDGKIMQESNLKLDKFLRSEDPDWGLRDVSVLTKLGEKNGMRMEEILDTCGDDKTILWRKC